MKKASFLGTEAEASSFFQNPENRFATPHDMTALLSN
jgi:hypothetical protein